MCLCRFVALRVTLNRLCCGLLSRIQLRVIDQSWHTGRNESVLHFQAEAPAEIFSGGGQATYPLFTGSIKTLLLQPEFAK